MIGSLNLLVIVLCVLALITDQALAEEKKEDKKIDSTPEFRKKINDEACDAVSNVACQKVFQACMTPTYGLIPFFEICAELVKVDLTDPMKVYSGFCDDRDKGLTAKNEEALKCVCDRMAVFGEDAVLEGIKVCEKAVKENCKIGA